MKACNEDIVNQWLIDDALKDLIEMELKNRKQKGDTEGFEKGSEYWLKFKIGKIEQDWIEKGAGEAKTKGKRGGADNSNNLEEELQKTTKQNKGEENSMVFFRGYLGMRA